MFEKSRLLEDYIRNVIREYGASKISEVSKIYVRRPDLKDFAGNSYRYEFGHLSSNNEWAAVNMVKLALYELGISNAISITSGTPIVPLPKHENILVIDMTKLKALNKNNK